MRRTYVLFIATALVLSLADSATAQKRAARGSAARGPAVKEAAVEVSQGAFTVSTKHETWKLGDLEPTESVIFDGAPLPIGSRRLTRTKTSNGATDITFPVADYVFYEQDEAKSDIQSVVGRYEAGRLTAIYVFYKPQTVAMPRDGFALMANGKSLYKTIVSVQNGNGTYLKQAISYGANHPNGGLWIDTLAISNVRPVAAKSASARSVTAN
jgi:hypothetical protein